MRKLPIRVPTRYFSNTFKKISEIKKCSSNFPSIYQSSLVESEWYDWWKSQKYFEAQKSKNDNTFIMILPPPNITGKIHLGHALTATIQDAIIRWKRMLGYETSWIPGVDHAGIATQVVVERYLKASRQCLRKEDLGREEFVKEVWKWKNKYGTEIYKQLQLLGASLDFSQSYFTMDESHSETVNEAFIRLYKNQYIYKKEKLVNWSCSLGSNVSDIEVDHKKIEGCTTYAVPGYEKPINFGLMYDFAYKVEDEPNIEIVVSTTRPETMLGDVAVAVHPEDKRYSSLLGKKLIHPFRVNHKIPIISDHRVDPLFGTGALKITPGHDYNDFEIASSHGLPILNILDKLGHIHCPEAFEFHGMKRFHARDAIIDALKHRNLFRKCESHSSSLPICSRSNDVIEPFLTSQWFLKTEKMFKRALEDSENGDLKFNPSSYKNVWNHWMSSHKTDWCISRQLWWGHRIPIWYVEYDDNTTEILSGKSEKEIVRHLTKPNRINKLYQDSDVLDTWFSSALLPLSLFGWPHQINGKTISLMETGNDIIFFWVARMVMLGTHFTSSLPFKEVCLHGLICDSHGRKMSKSLGNVINPLHIIQGISLESMKSELNQSLQDGYLTSESFKDALKRIEKQYPEGMTPVGADALRFSLCSYNIKETVIKLDPDIIKSAHTFCNKIWQLTRFLHLNFQKEPIQTLQLESKRQLEDDWIYSQTAATVRIVNEKFQEMEFHSVTNALRTHIISHICDVYLEIVKFNFNHNASQKENSYTHLYTMILTALQLLHPIMPFITEELYQRLPFRESRKDSIMINDYPVYDDWKCYENEKLNSSMESALKIVSLIRSTKQMYELKNSDHPEVKIAKCNLSQDFKFLIQRLSKCGQVSFVDEEIESLPSNWSVTPNSNGILFVKLFGFVNIEKELRKIQEKENRLWKKMRKCQEGENSLQFSIYENDLKVLSSQREFLNQITM